MGVFGRVAHKATGPRCLCVYGVDSVKAGERSSQAGGITPVTCSEVEGGAEESETHPPPLSP